MVDKTQKWVPLKASKIALLATVFACSNVHSEDQFVHARSYSDATHHRVDIPALNAAEALNMLAKQTQALMIFPYDIAESRMANATEGVFTIKEAVDSLLLDSGLVADLSTKGVIRIRLTDNADNNNRKSSDMNVSKNFLASAIAMIVGSQQAYGQEDSNQSPTTGSEASQTIDEVVVTGIRGSVKRAMDLKQLSDVVVDGIAAEDLGKFPDQNVAESLQRIPGISIDRSDGEGQRITVRGFGPEFNAVLFNGRVLATESQGRDFSFDVFASDIINGANAYKTTSADMLSGGIGATVNLTTARPMDHEGLKTALTTKTTYDTLAEENNPYISGAISYSNDKWGVLVSANHLSRDYRTDSINTEGWFPTQALSYDDNGNRVANSNIDFQGSGDPTQPVYIPRTLSLETDRGNRERTGGTAAFQFAPHERLTFTVDALYSKFEVNSEKYAHGAWTADWSAEQNRAGWASANIDSNQTLTAWEYSRIWDTGWDPRYRVMSHDNIYIENNRPTETQQIGFNMDWQISDRITLTYDYSTSEAENSNGGGNRFLIAKDRYANVSIDYNNGDYPSFSFADHYEVDPLDSSDDAPPLNLVTDPFRPEDLRSHQMYLNGATNEDEVDQHRIDLEFDFDQGVISKISGGLYASSRTQLRFDVNSGAGLPWNLVSGAYNDGRIDLPDELFTRVDLGDFFNGSYPPLYRIDPNGIIQYLNSDEAIDQLDNAEEVRELRDVRFAGSPLGIFTPIRNGGWKVDEDIFEAYVKVDFGGDNWSGNFGLRHSDTETTSYGSEEPVLNITRNSDDATILVLEMGERVPVSESNSYKKLLPSLNLRYEPAENHTLRFAASKTLTRPTLNQLRPGLGSYNGRFPNATASAGNPLLEPYESTNLDISYEWYFGDLSYFSAAFFQKEAENFIVNASVIETILEGNEYGDFLVQRPRNNEDSSLMGLELSFQHTFESGFGFQSNYTFTEPEDDFDAVAFENGQSQGFPLEGLSDSANFIAFYENDRFQARIAYNWRDEFLRSQRGQQGRSETQEAYEQIDVSASYDLTDNFSILFEGINVTEETRRSYSIYQNRLLTIEDTGARYSLGIRATF